MAPTLIEYIRWVLKCAEEDGKKRLYFLARDGYQMYLAARHYTESAGIDIECRYLNVSRYAIRVPEYHLIGEKCLDRICIGGIDVTFEKVMKRAGLDDIQAMEIAEACGYKEKYRQVLGYTQVMGLKDILKGNAAFFEYVYTRSKELYSSAMGYLEQEGLFDDVPYGIVDSGWIGTMQQTLRNLLEGKGKKGKMTGYYFGLYETPKDSQDIYKAYYFTPGNGLGRKVNFSNCLFEAVFTSTEGMTLYYDKTEQGYRPVFDNKKNPNAEQIADNIALLTEYLSLYDGYRDKISDDSKASMGRLKMISRLLKSFMGYPSKEELEAYGENLFSDDVLEGKLQKVAAELSDEEIRNQRFINKALIMTGLKKKVIHESAWIEGSIVRNGRRVKGNLRHARLYKYFIYIRKMMK